MAQISSTNAEALLRALILLPIWDSNRVLIGALQKRAQEVIEWNPERKVQERDSQIIALQKLFEEVEKFEEALRDSELLEPEEPNKEQKKLFVQIDSAREHHAKTGDHVTGYKVLDKKTVQDFVQQKRRKRAM